MANGVAGVVAEAAGDEVERLHAPIPSGVGQAEGQEEEVDEGQGVGQVDGQDEDARTASEGAALDVTPICLMMANSIARRRRVRRPKNSAIDSGTWTRPSGR